MSLVLLLWGVIIVGFADWIARRALGAHLVLSLLMLIPVYFAVRVVGTRSGMLFAASGGLFCLVLDVFVLSTAVTFSIGAITFDSPPTSPNEAIRVADALMYEAKRGGKDRVVHATAGSAAQRVKGQRRVA